ncbi:hypothetical protein D805_1828 [Bifidobacterium thermophilum RBL67]|uniref:Uncharacterized protein n=1 Tax=Bifidobacterium thermophilum RBL67 TaxID=1254439 RepID=M4REZ7_9BIFI|nr:hypothetical protein D805_1828 [Bifidobacterium thermophilum RBL67]
MPGDAGVAGTTAQRLQHNTVRDARAEFAEMTPVMFILGSTPCSS